MRVCASFGTNRPSPGRVPREELLTIARTTRNRVYRAAAEIEKEARNAALASAQLAQQLTERKRQLIQQGMAYTRRELEAVADLNGLDRWIIEQRVERQLQSIKGDETRSEIIDKVEDILESKGIDGDDWDND